MICWRKKLSGRHRVHGHSVVLAKKISGGWRFCVDYRSLNDVTVTDSYPLPRLDDVVERLAGARYFSTLDLAGGF